MSIVLPGPDFDRLVESLDVPDECPVLDRLRRRPRRFQRVSEPAELLSPAEARELTTALLQQADADELEA